MKKIIKKLKKIKSEEKKWAEIYAGMSSEEKALYDIEEEKSKMLTALYALPVDGALRINTVVGEPRVFRRVE